jgi:hypothetical protein
MKRVILATAAVLVLATAPAMADVILDPHLSGTGDNVVFDSFNGTNQAIGVFNGQNVGEVKFTDLSGNPGFFGAANGNDIKIANTSDLSVVVFDSTGTTVLPTATDVFSLKGTGVVTIAVQATDGTFTFTPFTIDPSAQTGFTLSAINGEVISGFTVVDTGGVISDFEHYRVDVAASVPGPIVGAGLPGLITALFGMVGLNRFRQRRRVA